jgi:SAM-dependent MidA family methyltransferase
VSGEFQSATDNQVLKDRIVSRIRAEGGIAFHDFMEMALYTPELGYYHSPGEKMGTRGDYMTSPEVSSIFGTLVGRQLREMWEIMDRPASFLVVEGGAGSGSLARDILWWAERSAPEFRSSLDYTIVESSEAMMAQQRSKLADAASVIWSEDLPDDIEGCILTNELLDAFPVHRVTVRDGTLHEIFVIWHEDGYFDEELRPPVPEVTAYFERLYVLPGEGCTAEVNLESINWMRSAGRALRRGYVMTFDYGYEAADMFAPWRSDGTLLCFYRHNPSSDPYVRIGKQDMTAHVDFTSLIAAGEEAGLATVALVTQSSFVEQMGIDQAMKPPEGADLEAYYTRRRQVTELLDPGGLGRIKLLVQSKNVPDAALTGLGGPSHA